jgi:type VI secretion system protein ImpH
MADENRTPPHPLTLLEQLRETAYAFDFYQALRRLDCSFPDKPPTGQSSRAVDDPVRIGQEASMAFAPATLQSVETREDLPPRMTQRFFGLLGPQGPLPLHLTDYIRDRLRNHDDETLLKFLDVFHHRMITLFYRAWARVRPTVSFDQPAWDRFSDYAGSLFGLGMATLLNRDSLPDLPKRHFTGLMSCQTRHADGLLAILKGYFNLPVQVDEFVGQWVELPANCRCLLGLSSSKLGVDTTVGSHIWDCQQKFRVVLGPLTLEEYYRMLPGRSQLSEECDDPSPEPSDALEPSANGQPPADSALGETPLGKREPVTAGIEPQPVDQRLTENGESPFGAPAAHDEVFADPTEGEPAGEDHALDDPYLPTSSRGSRASVDSFQDVLNSGELGYGKEVPSSGKLGYGSELPSSGEFGYGDAASVEAADDPFFEQELGAVLDELAMQGTALGFRRSEQVDAIESGWPYGQGTDSTRDELMGGGSPQSPFELVEERTPDGQSSAGETFTGRQQRSPSSAARQAAAGELLRRAAAARGAAKRGVSLDRMIAAVRAYVGDELQWDLQLILQKEETPPIGLGLVGNLGWSSWVIRDNMPYDPNDLVLDAMGTPPEKQLIEFRHVRAWDHKTLGQRRNGQYIVATIDMGDLSVVQTALST